MDLKVNLAYEDSTTRTYTYGAIQEDLVLDDEKQEIMRQKAKNVNANMPESFKKTFISPTGAPVQRIKSLEVIIKSGSKIY